jgi:hypothetical protein
MMALLQKLNLKAESHPAHQLLASGPRGATEDLLELVHGFSRKTRQSLRVLGS